LIRLLYSNAKCLVKVNNRLCAPFDFSRGIRQGCPLSGSLYALSIEPLLHFIRKSADIRGFSPDPSVPPVKSSAYADDVDAFLTRDSEFEALHDCLGVYERASSAEVNLVKTEGLWSGSWRGRRDAPLGLRWNSDGLKCLGAFVGNTEAFEKRNWDGLFEAVSDRISRWKPLFRHLSFKGRAILINSLAASKLWHRLHVFTPPPALVRRLQKFFVDVVWLDAKHWLRPEALALHPDDGGLGLADVATKISCFRVQYLKDLFYSGSDHPAHAVAEYLFKQFLDLDYSHHWLSCRPPATVFSGHDRAFTPLRECLEAWQGLTTEAEFSASRVVEEPIFFNSVFPIPLPGQSILAAAGVTKLKQLLNADGSFVPAERLHEAVNRRSLRLLRRETDAVARAVPERWSRALTRNAGRASPKKFFIKDPFDPGRRLPLDGVAAKQLYYLTCRTRYAKASARLPGGKWQDILHLERTPSFLHFYKFPIPSDMADVQWRVAHGAVATGHFRYDAGFAPTPACPFCGEFDDLLHTFFKCPNVNGLSDWIGYYLDAASPGHVPDGEEYVFLQHRIANAGKRLTNFVFAASKFATYKAVSCKNYGEGPTDPVSIVKSTMKKVISNHYFYSAAIGQLDRFSRFWCFNDALCRLTDDGDLLWSDLLL